MLVLSIQFFSQTELFTKQCLFVGFVGQEMDMEYGKMDIEEASAQSERAALSTMPNATDKAPDTPPMSLSRGRLKVVKEVGECSLSFILLLELMMNDHNNEF